MIEDRREGQPLTKAQLDVLAIAAQGFTNEQIGRILNRSPLTIKNHIQTVLRKLGAHNRINAIYMAISQGALECPNPDHERCGHPIGITRASDEPPPKLEVPRRPEVVKPLETANDTPIQWIEAGDIQINMETFTMRIKGKDVPVRRRSVELLYYLLRHVGKVFTRQHLLNVGWGELVDVEERLVDVHIACMRRVLKLHGYGNLIRTVRNTGYGIIELPWNDRNLTLATIS